MNNLLLFMCLTGSLMYVFYLLLCAVFRQRFHPALRLYMLLAAGCFFTLPFPLEIGKHQNRVKQLIRSFNPDYSTAIYRPYTKIAVRQADGSLAMPEYPRIFWILLAIWGSVLLFLLIRHFVKYAACKKKCLKTSVESNFTHSFRCFPGIRRKIPVRILPTKRSPFVIGYFKPVIFINEESTENLDRILQHELYHVSHFNNFIKLWGFLVFALHWYCPLSFLYFLSLSNTLELLCDRKVLQNASPEERREYVYLLLGISKEEKTAQPHTFLSTFRGLNFYLTKERIAMIKHFNAKFSFTALICAVVFTFVSVIPALAYDTIDIEQASDGGTNLNKPGGETLFVPDGEEFPEKYARLEETDEELHFNVSDHYFISDDGQIYYDLPDDAAYAACKHTYVEGYSYSHDKLSNGGCTYKKYRTKLCTKCDYTASSTLVHTVTSAKCTH